MPIKDLLMLLAKIILKYLKLRGIAAPFCTYTISTFKNNKIFAEIMM